MNNKIDITGVWGRADQKIILVHGEQFDELQEHLKNGYWEIESISACSNKVFNNINPACYVLLHRN